ARLSAHDPARQQLEVRATALKHEHLSAWSGDWQTLVTKWPGQDGLWFERGLLRPNLTGVSWLRGVPPDHPAWTWVDGLKLLGLSPREASRLASPQVLGNLNPLDLHPAGQCESAVGPDGARAIAESPHLARLTSLVLFDTGIKAEGATALAGTPHLNR